MEHYQTGKARSLPSLARYSCLALGLMLMLTISFTSAAVTIPTNELAMDEIFGAGNFGSETIDIRFNAQMTLVDPTLTTIDNAYDWDVLVDVDLGLATTVVHMFVVDEIDWCGGNGSYAGCGQEPGNRFAVDVEHINGPIAGVLYAHELGHNLDLIHVPIDDNLMEPNLGANNVNLTPSQVTTALGAFHLIQMDGAQRFIEITPIFISATSVPIPGALVMIFSGAACLGIRRRRTAH